MCPEFLALKVVRFVYDTKCVCTHTNLTTLKPRLCTISKDSFQLNLQFWSVASLPGKDSSLGVELRCPGHSLLQASFALEVHRHCRCVYSNHKIPQGKNNLNTSRYSYVHVTNFKKSILFNG